MNANELADELERLYQQDIIDGVADLAMPEAATMLRQLSNQVGIWEKTAADARVSNALLKAEIEELKKRELTLTNDEIKEVIKSLEDSIYFGETLGFFELKDFALAVLRKAQSE